MRFTPDNLITQLSDSNIKILAKGVFLGKQQSNMSARQNNFETIINQQNISYYNEIAESYDAILDEDDSNELVRQKVSQEFCNSVQEGTVLDFGGGTGRDLSWLTQQQYNIIFCEPAIAMRNKAIEYNNTTLHNTAINFLNDDKADFRNWHTLLPFAEKADAVLSNFAVLNCIADIELVFKNLALVTRPGAHFFALVLENSFKKRSESNFKGTLLSIFTGKTVSYDIYHEGSRQQVYIHSARSIKKRSAKYFSFIAISPLDRSGFRLLQLIRK